MASRFMNATQDSRTHYQELAGVLVIDDEYGARLQVELALMTSATVRLVGQASNGMRGAELAEQLQPDIIVLDLSMPVMGGLEALPLLKKVAPRAVILVRSNCDDPGIEDRVLALGAAQFLPTMMAPDEMREAVEQAVRSQVPAAASHIRAVRRAAGGAIAVLSAVVIAGCGTGTSTDGSSAGSDSSASGSTSTNAQGSSAASYDIEAKPYPAFTKPVTAGPKTFRLTATERKLKVGDKVYEQWTFNDSVPGPVLRVVEGDRVTIDLKNAGDSKLPHSVDFHSARISPTRAFASIAPGKSISYTFTAEYPGVFMYHCGTPPVLQHIGMGMYGMIIVQPKQGFGQPMQEIALTQSELYNSYPDMEKGQVDAMAFNGIPSQYAEHQIHLTGAKPKVRVFVLNAGPSEVSSFHVVGTVFDRVYPDGDPRNVTYSRQALAVPASGGGVFEMQLTENGSYPFVTHQFNHAGKGAVGMLHVGPQPEQTGEHR